MEKNKAYLVVAPIVVSLICIVLAVYATVYNSQLNAERSKAAGLNAQIVNLRAQLSDAQARYNEQARIGGDLQNSLDAARREADAARREADAARTEAERARREVEALSASTTPAE